jgi:hypothetical protein
LKIYLEFTSQPVYNRTTTPTTAHPIINKDTSPVVSDIASDIAAGMTIISPLVLTGVGGSFCGKMDAR